MWGLVDCDSFFCSCERVFRPELNGKPVVVLSNNDGCCLAISREAKKMGADTVILASQQYSKKDNSGKSVRFSHAIKRALLSPDYSTSIDAFTVK